MENQNNNRDSEEEAVREKLAFLFAKAYIRVPWQRIARGRRSAYDIFQHRLKVAGTRSSIPQVLEKLCHGLSLQSVSVDPAVITELEHHRDTALKILREESVYLTLLAAQKAKSMKQEQSKQNKEE